MTRRELVLQEFEKETNTRDKIQELVDEAYQYFSDFSIYTVLDKDRGDAVNIMQRLYMGADPIKIDKYLDVLGRLKLEMINN